MGTEVVVARENPVEMIRQATDVAGACRDIVVATACNIQGRKYVKVEGWQAIAIAHGCMLSARDVKRIEGGVTAVGEVRRGSDGMVLATAEGFVGDDERTWGNRDEYAKRAMAQTRAMSRAARSAFAHIVVMMNAGLETTPAEEIPEQEKPTPTFGKSSITMEQAQAQAEEARRKGPPNPCVDRVKDVTSKMGTKKDGSSYTRYTIELGKFGFFSTFSQSFADVAADAREIGGEVRIRWKTNPTNEKWRDIEAIEPVASNGRPVPAEPVAIDPETVPF